MKQIILSLLLTLLLVNAVQAENWELINKDGAESTFYIDKENIKTDGDIKILWGKIVLGKKVKEAYKKATGIDAQYNKMHMGIDCKTKTACQFGFMTYDENNNIVEENEIKEDNRVWTDITKGRPIESVYKAVCQ